MNRSRNFEDDDGDGVANIMDCRPQNPRMQHIKPNIAQRKRMEKLPILVSDEPFRTYHILSKEAKKKAPIARTRTLAMMKKYPGIIGEIERKKPPEIAFISFSTEDLGTTEADTKRVKVYPPRKKTDTKKEYYKSGTWYIKQQYKKEDQPYHLKQIKHHLKRYGFKGETKGTVEKKRRYSMAHTTFHELEHVEQLNKGGRDFLIKEIKTIPKYWKRRSEQDAEKHAHKKMKEYKKRKPMI